MRHMATQVSYQEAGGYMLKVRDRRENSVWWRWNSGWMMKNKHPRKLQWTGVTGEDTLMEWSRKCVAVPHHSSRWQWHWGSRCLHPGGGGRRRAASGQGPGRSSPQTLQYLWELPSGTSEQLWRKKSLRLCQSREKSVWHISNFIMF